MKKTSIITAAVLVASFGLVGCGGGGGGSGSASTTVEGTAVDPELIGATVCFDMNKDDTCDRVGVQTDENGTYRISLNDSDLQTGVTLLVKGGYDRVTKMPFVGTMRTMVIESTATAQQMITPLTTLVYERAVAMGGDIQANIQAAKEEVAALLGISVADLQANMMELAEDGEAEALQAAMAMQQAAELAADANNTRAFYQMMAASIPPSQGNNVALEGVEGTQNAFAGLIIAAAENNLTRDSVEQLRVKYFAQAMDEMGAVADPELYAMGVEKMQEMILRMDSMDIIIEEVSSFVTGIMDSLDNVEAFVTTYLLERAGVAQDVIDQVVPVIIANAEITVDTGFGMMIDTLNEENVKAALINPPTPVITQDQYNEMIAQLTEMQAEFESAE